MICTNCREDKPLDGFYRNSTKAQRSGYRTVCKDCEREKYYAKQRGEVGMDHIPQEFVEWVRRPI